LTDADGDMKSGWTFTQWHGQNNAVIALNDLDRRCRRGQELRARHPGSDRRRRRLRSHLQPGFGPERAHRHRQHVPTAVRLCIAGRRRGDAAQRRRSRHLPW
jgi:hypothetical protein